jgi:hypothetical protein
MVSATQMKSQLISYIGDGKYNHTENLRISFVEARKKRKEMRTQINWVSGK